MTTKYITIDNDGTSARHRDAEEALYLADRRNKAGSGYQPNAFRIDWDENGVATPTRLEPPKPQYWADVRGDQGGNVSSLKRFSHGMWSASEIENVYEKDSSGNLMRLNDADKAKAITAWKNGELA